ncbi:hypothetical protein T11_8563 [Trichinella zimbabwensis]|uniref:Uncharacterized protein n=1 Tax=Trichinella zimbabwensis TaxID=268475 RepID=A0A0V1GQD3_9BILA|nr:hypothetical protein T11_8563 [Trichinella zimbabwensis]
MSKVEQDHRSYSDYDRPLLDCHYDLRQRFDPETTHLFLLKISSVWRIIKDDVKSGTRSSYVSLNPKRFVPHPLRRLYLKSLPSVSRFCWRSNVFPSPLTGGSYSDYDRPLLDCHYNLRQRFDPETTHLILSHSILLQYVHAKWPWSRPTKHQLLYASAIHSVVVIAVTGPVDVRCGSSILGAGMLPGISNTPVE